MSPSVTAIQKLKEPIRERATEVRLPVRSDVDVAELLLNSAAIKADIGDSVIDGSIERTIEGPSTISLTLSDPDRNLLRSGLFGGEGGVLPWSVLKLDSLGFALAQVDKQGDAVALAFEDREVAWLRRYDDPLRADRSKVTRAEFVAQMVREVREGRIRLYCPELHKRQPQSETDLDEPRVTRSRPTEIRRGSGFGPGVRLNGKQGPLSPSALKNAATVLSVADALDAPRNAKLALLEACMIEAPDFYNNPGGDRTSRGILQLLSSTAAGLGVNPLDVAAVARLFLTRGFYSNGGAISQARNDPNKKPGDIAQDTQGSAVPDAYATVGPQALAILSAWGGGDVETSGGRTTIESTVIRPYRFTRGMAGKPENSWQAIQRLAGEVQWRAFMNEGTLYFLSEDDLFRSRPRMVLREGEGGVDTIDFDIDVGKKASTATVQCRADRWQADPGTVVLVEDLGPADGRWLVASVRRGVYDAACEIELKKPMAPKPEPANETATRSRSFVTQPAGGGLRRSGGEIRPGLGAKQIVEDAFRLAAKFDENIFVVSAYRPGDPLDHGSNDADKAARDIAYRGIDALVGPPHPSLNRACVALGEAFGRSGYGNGTSGPFQNADTFSWHGFRVQIIWQTTQWGGHLGHIHIGARKE